MRTIILNERYLEDLAQMYKFQLQGRDHQKLDFLSALKDTPSKFEKRIVNYLKGWNLLMFASLRHDAPRETPPRVKGRAQIVPYFRQFFAKELAGLPSESR